MPSTQTSVWEISVTFAIYEIHATCMGIRRSRRPGTSGNPVIACPSISQPEVLRSPAPRTPRGQKTTLCFNSRESLFPGNIATSMAVGLPLAARLVWVVTLRRRPAHLSHLSHLSELPEAGAMGFPGSRSAEASWPKMPPPRPPSSGLYSPLAENTTSQAKGTNGRSPAISASHQPGARSPPSRRSPGLGGGRPGLLTGSSRLPVQKSLAWKGTKTNSSATYRTTPPTPCFCGSTTAWSSRRLRSSGPSASRAVRRPREISLTSLPFTQGCKPAAGCTTPPARSPPTPRQAIRPSKATPSSGSRR